jgi:MFS family permease
MGTAAEAVRESGRALAEVFRNDGLRRVQLAFGASVVGDSAYLIALFIYAFEQGGPTAVGLLGVARYGVAATVTPFASTLADRKPRRRVMIGADLARVVLVVAAAAVIAAGGAPIAVYALAVAAFACGTPFRPAQSALLPGLARTPAELTAANVSASTLEGVGFFLGPAVGALLLAVAEIPEVVLFNALTFLVSALLLRGVREPARGGGGAPAGEHARGHVLREASEGFRTILADRDLRALTVLFAVQCLAAGAVSVLVVTTALDLLDLGNPGVALLEGALGAGGLLGGFLALALSRGDRLARNFAAGVVLWGLPMVAVAARPELGAALVAMAFIGLGNAVVDVNAFTILQRVVPDHVMGRVFGAIETILVGAIGLGALLTPALIAGTGVRGARRPSAGSSASPWR